MRPGALKRIIPVLLITGAVLFLASSLKKPPPAPPAHTVRVQESVRSPYFLPQYLALNLGFFKEQNLEVKITTTSPEAIRAALADGRTDIALCGLQKIIFNPATRGPQPRVFATLAGKDGSFLLARKDAGDFQWLKLKHLAIIGGSQDDSSEIALEDVLRRHGLPPYRDVTIYNNIPDMLRTGAFRAGTGNYIQLLEPEASLAESRGYARVAASVGEAAGDMLVTAYAAPPGYLEDRPEVVQGFTNAIYKAQLWLERHSNEEAAAAAAPSFPHLDKLILLKSVERYRSLGIWTKNPLVPRETYERFCKAAKESGEIASPAPYESTVVTDFARVAVETVVCVPEEEKPKKKSFFRNIFRD